MTSQYHVFAKIPCRLFFAVFLFAAIVHKAMPLSRCAEAIRVLPPGELPKDKRLEPLKDLNGYFPFNRPGDAGAWSKRAVEVRRRLLVTLGLWPLPNRTPLNAVIHGKIDLGDYTIEKVFFESVPGFFVTGNLYRPKGGSGKLPAVLSPHGHWNDGRFTDAGEEAVRKEIAQGAERFENGGRSPLQSRCVQLARMGCVVFHYDMIGYADSQQISQGLAHGFSKQRPEMNTVENWGLFSPQAEAHFQSVMGLQTWNSLRALDFLEGLPDVDPKRIAVTGASGGGTQTFVLCALDPRPAVAFPAVMVSTAMQGGCTCENASGLRIGMGNVDIAALFAPKPLGMTAANDWTKEMESKGFPELQQHYQAFGMSGNVRLTPLTHFGHNYNYVSRGAMYSWLNQHLKLGFKNPIVEEDYKRLSTHELSVWDERHPEPPSGPDFERGLLRRLAEDDERNLAVARKSLADFRTTIGGAVDVIIGRAFSEVGEVNFDMTAKSDRGDYLEMTGLLRNGTYGEELPSVLLHPNDWNKRTVIWIDESGKAGLFGRDGGLRPEIRRLIDAGFAVAGVDLLYQGEFLPDGNPITQTRRVNNTREFAGYTYGYNNTLFARRVHDILTIVKYVKENERQSTSITLVGLEGAGPWVAAARALARDAAAIAVVDTRGFRFGKVLDIRSPSFLPGGAKYGDLPGMLALGAPGKLWVAGEENESSNLVKSIYEKAGAIQNLTRFVGARERVAAEAVNWLIAN